MVEGYFWGENCILYIVEIRIACIWRPSVLNCLLIIRNVHSTITIILFAPAEWHCLINPCKSFVFYRMDWWALSML